MYSWTRSGPMLQRNGDAFDGSPVGLFQKTGQVFVRFGPEVLVTQPNGTIVDKTAVRHLKPVNDIARIAAMIRSFVPQFDYAMMKDQSIILYVLTSVELQIWEYPPSPWDHYQSMPTRKWTMKSRMPSPGLDRFCTARHGERTFLINSSGSVHLLEGNSAQLVGNISPTAGTGGERVLVDDRNTGTVAILLVSEIQANTHGHMRRLLRNGEVIDGQLSSAAVEACTRQWQ